jgi:hypothetical protein
MKRNNSWYIIFYIGSSAPQKNRVEIKENTAHVENIGKIKSRIG